MWNYLTYNKQTNKQKHNKWMEHIHKEKRKSHKSNSELIWETEEDIKEPNENILIEAKLKYSHINLEDVKFQYRYRNANPPHFETNEDSRTENCLDTINIAHLFWGRKANLVTHLPQGSMGTSSSFHSPQTFSPNDDMTIIILGSTQPSRWIIQLKHKPFSNADTIIIIILES